MNEAEAWKLIKEYYNKYTAQEEDIQAFIEASEYLLESVDEDTQIVLYNLASLCNDEEIYRLSKKYFERIVNEYEKDFITCAMAYLEISKLYAYGLGVEIDYDKSYQLVNKSLSMFQRKNAKVHKLFLRKKLGIDMDRFEMDLIEVAEQVFEEEKTLRKYGGDIYRLPIPEMSLLLCECFYHNSVLQQKLQLLLTYAKNFLLQRMLQSKNPINYILMEQMENYPIQEPYIIYDVMNLMKKGKVSFEYKGKKYEIILDSQDAIQFENKYYRTPLDFLKKAEINGERISSIAHEIINVCV